MTVKTEANRSLPKDDLKVLANTFFALLKNRTARCYIGLRLRKVFIFEWKFKGQLIIYFRSCRRCLSSFRQQWKHHFLYIAFNECNWSFFSICGACLFWLVLLSTHSTRARLAQQQNWAKLCKFPHSLLLHVSNLYTCSLSVRRLASFKCLIKCLKGLWCWIVGSKR